MKGSGVGKGLDDRHSVIADARVARHSSPVDLHPQNPIRRITARGRLRITNMIMRQTPGV